MLPGCREPTTLNCIAARRGRNAKEISVAVLELEQPPLVTRLEHANYLGESFSQPPPPSSSHWKFLSCMAIHGQGPKRWLSLPNRIMRALWRTCCRAGVPASGDGIDHRRRLHSRLGGSNMPSAWLSLQRPQLVSCSEGYLPTEGPCDWHGGRPRTASAHLLPILGHAADGPFQKSDATSPETQFCNPNVWSLLTECVRGGTPIVS